MDRQAWIAVSLCVLGLIAWQFYMVQHAPRLPATAPPVTASPGADPAAASPAPTTGLTSSPVAAPAAAAATPAPEAAFEEKIETLRNGDVELRLTNRGGGIAEAHLLNHAGRGGQGHVVLNSSEHLPIGAILEDPNTRALPEFTMARQPDGSVQFERSTAGGVTVRKRFKLSGEQQKKDDFVSHMELEFRNDGPQPYTSPGYFVALGATVPLDRNAYIYDTRLVWYTDGKAKGIDVNWFPAQTYPVVGVERREARDFYRERLQPPGDWAAMSNQFFTTIITPLDGKVSEMWGRRFDVKFEDGYTTHGLEGAFSMPGYTLQPGQSSTVRFQVYTGPKLYAKLTELKHDEAAIMNFGFWKLVSQALLNLMNLLHSWVGNYGLAIVLLTACVKAVLWPLQNKANASMRRMSVLAPKMQELKDKYKDDPTRMNQEVMKLYKQYGVNPVGGCLPMMIQIPIFFGLFTMLGQAAELRNASFLWVDDLSQPDVLARVPGLGWPINLLPILMGASNVWLMQMTPKTGDAMQRRILMFMPLIFLVFCYNFAAALALYYTVQNLFTILQLWHNQRQPMPVVEKVAPPGKPAKKRRT